MSSFIRPLEGGRIRVRNWSRIIVLTVAILFVLSALSFSGTVSAGRRDPGPKGTCLFNVGLHKEYNLGDTIEIIVQGDWGKATRGFFEFDLITPSQALAMKLYWYLDDYPTGFNEWKTYTANQAGIWTAQLTYNVPGKRNMQTTVEGFDQVPVIGPATTLTLVQTSYDAINGLWQGLATLQDMYGQPMVGATVVLQYSTDGGLTWRNTRQGSEVTDAAGQASMHTTGNAGLTLRV